jgi:mRNA interferase RelE/StbE
MASYEIEISRTAEKQLKNLATVDQRRVAAAILALANNPFPRGSRKLSGYEGVFRIRAGCYRILYSASARSLIIIILKIGHRSDVYP